MSDKSHLSSQYGCPVSGCELKLSYHPFSNKYYCESHGYISHKIMSEEIVNQWHLSLCHEDREAFKKLGVDPVGRANII